MEHRDYKKGTPLFSQDLLSDCKSTSQERLHRFKSNVPGALSMQRTTNIFILSFIVQGFRNGTEGGGLSSVCIPYAEGERQDLGMLASRRMAHQLAYLNPSSTWRPLKTVTFGYVHSATARAPASPLCAFS